MKLIQRCLLVLFAATFGVVHAATTIYVDSNAADDNGDGLSLATAKKTIQAAIDIAGKNDTILIKAGTYQISSSLTIAGEDKHIELRGATGNPADVVVDAQGQCPCLVSLHTNQIIVSSITFENGRSTVEPDVAGGITATDKSMITNCIVRSCYHGVSGKDVYGGGIYLSTDKFNPNNSGTNWPSARRFLPQVANTAVENCAVYVEDGSNERRAQGGGVFLEHHNTSGLTVQNCAVTNFSKVGNLTEGKVIYIAGGGAYLYGGSHTGDTFLCNALEPLADTSGYLGAGAGVYVVGYSTSDGNIVRRGVLSDSLVSGNMSHGCGAGVGVGSYVTIDGCSIVSNRLSNGKSTTYYQIGGAAVYVPGAHSQIANSLIAGNISTNEANAAVFAGTIAVNNANNFVIRDCVIRDNVLQNAGALSCVSAGGLLVSNCVMSANVAIDKVSTVRFYTNQQSPDDCGMALITDCYIVSNAVTRITNHNECVTLMYYGSQSSRRIAAPLTLRNCLFAGNRSKPASSSKGWGIFGNLGTYSDLVCDDKGFLLTFDHCTFAKNVNGGGASKIFAGFSSEAVAQYAHFKGCAFWKNTYSTSCSVTTNSAHFANCYADVTNEAFTVTTENGNIGGEDAGDVKFANPDNLDFRLASGSCLINKGGEFADWMGTGRRNSVHDMGAGYVIGTLGNYGVTVGRRESNPRRCGTASDIGCCELWWPKGTVMSVR